MMDIKQGYRHPDDPHKIVISHAFTSSVATVNSGKQHPLFKEQYKLMDKDVEEGHPLPLPVDKGSC
jgi:hypothetical protein